MLAKKDALMDGRDGVLEMTFPGALALAAWRTCSIPSSMIISRSALVAFLFSSTGLG